MHSRGFVNTGLKEILEAAGVPKGSFYFYFKSKEDFGQALVEHLSEFVSAFLNRHLDNRSLPPLDRLMGFFDASCALYEKNGFRGGCPIGNLSLEMSDLSEPMRVKLAGALSKMRTAIRKCLAESQERGELDKKWDPGDLALFMLNAWEGALIDMKVSKSMAPLRICRRMLTGIFTK